MIVSILANIASAVAAAVVLAGAAALVKWWQQWVATNKQRADDWRRLDEMLEFIMKAQAHQDSYMRETREILDMQVGAMRRNVMEMQKMIMATTALLPSLPQSTPEGE